MGGDGAPAVCHGVSGRAGKHLLRGIKAVVHAHEGFAVCVKALERAVYAEEGVVVTALPVFCFMVEHVSFNLNLSGREIPLEILHVRGGVPKAPFGKGIQLDGFFGVSLVCDGNLVDLAAVADGDKEQDFGRNAVLFSGNAGVAHSVAAFIAVQSGFAGFPARIPDGASVLYVVVTAAVVHGDAVVPVPKDAAELCVFCKAVAASSI